MIRTSIYQVQDKELELQLRNSKLLYNKAQFLCRQNFFKNKNSKDLLKTFLFYNQLYSLLKNSTEYKSLPAQASQQVLKQVDDTWKGYRKSIKSYWKDKGKFKIIPKIPKYIKHSDFNTVLHPVQGLASFKDTLKIPLTDFKIVREKRIIGLKIKAIRLTSFYDKIKLELIYEKEIKKELIGNSYIGIDLGINNLMTITSDEQDLTPLLINGRPLKSMNQYFNKKKAYLTFLNASNQLKKLSIKRTNKVNDFLHKTSRYLINYCLKNNIGTIVIGRNINWKQGINIGKINNQNFVSIPFYKLIQMIKYKAEEKGINIILTEESYTSKIDNLANEGLHKQESYLGKRIKRGLFQSSVGKLINADVNGSLNILRKVISDDLLGDRGHVFCPVKVNIF